MKKALSLLLALVMICSLMIGCGSKETAPEETTPAATEETKTEEPKKEEAKEEEPAKEEAPAEWTEEGWLPLSDSNEVLTVGISQSSKVSDYNTNELTIWLEETTGIDLDFFYFTGSSAERRQQVSLMVAGGEKLPDVMFANVSLGKQLTNELGRDGYLVDLTPYMGDMNYTPYMTKALEACDENLYYRIMNAITDPETGGIYQAPWASQLIVADDIGTLGWINQKWLDTLGLEIPKTIDDLYEVMVAFKTQDPNGNGKADEIPMIGPLSSGGANMISYVINAFVYFDFDNHLNATDGQVWAPWASDEYRQALQFINKCAAEGLIAQQTFTGMESADTKPIYTPEDEVAIVGFAAGHSQVYMNQDNAAFYEYTDLPYLDDATGKGGYSVCKLGVVYNENNGSVISADCENVELAVKFIDYIYKDNVTASFRHGIQGVNWDWINPDNTDINFENIKVLDDGQAFFEGKYTWCGNTSCIFNNHNYISGGEPETEWYAHHVECVDRMVQEQMIDGRFPEETVRDFMFTSEQMEFYNSNKTVFTDYVKEALAKFATGVWDPNNDADWNTYLGELESLGLSEYLATAQDGYTKFREAYVK